MDMEKTFYIISMTALLALIGGFMRESNKHRREFSPILHESAVVEDTIYSPSKHSNLEALTYGRNGLGVAAGDAYSSEERIVIIKCQHGRFVVENDNLWEKLSKGDTVDLPYIEKYDVTYDNQRNVTKKEMTRRDHKFYDITKK